MYLRIKRFIFIPLLFGLSIVSCNKGISKSSFEKNIDNLPPSKQYYEAEYLFNHKITYLGGENLEEKNYSLVFSEELMDWAFYDEELDKYKLAYLFMPNLKTESAEQILKEFAPTMADDEYKVSYTFSNNPLSFSAKIKGINKPDKDYKDYQGKMYCEFDEYGWLIHMDAHFDKYMVKTNSNLIEDDDLNIIYK